MNPVREIAYRVDPALWMREVLGITPHAWQETFLRAERGASIVVLTARQVGKTTAAASAWHILRSSCRAPCLWLPVPPKTKAPKRSVRYATWC